MSDDGETAMSQDVDTSTHFDKYWSILKRNVFAQHKAWAVVSVAMLFLIGLALATHVLVTRAYKNNLRKNLQVISDVRVVMLEHWFEAQEAAVTSAANDADVRDNVDALLSEAHDSPDDWASLQASAHLSALGRELAPRLAAQKLASFVIIDRDLRIVAGSPGEQVTQGSQLEQQGLAQRLFVDEEATVTLPFASRGIWPETDDQGSAADAAMLAIAPVRDAGDDVVGALGFLIQPLDPFDRIFSAVRGGDSGETYMVDGHGVMLTPSRFEQELKQIGLLPNRDDATSPLHIELRDPQVDLTSGAEARLERSQQPLTKPAREAAEGTSGLDADGYRDYRGRMVIGIWKWLDDYGLAVVTEMDSQEVFRPLNLLNGIFWVLFGLLGLAVVSVFVFTLITTQIQQNAMQAANRQAVTLAGDMVLQEIRARGKFFADLGSGIRAPLHTVLEMGDLMMETQLELQQRRFLKTLLTSARSLEDVLNEILDLNQVEVGHLELHREVFAFREVLNELIGPLQIAARAEGKSLSANYHENVPDRLLGDVHRLQQVLRNLTAKAIELSGPAGVRIDVSVVDQSSHQVEVKVQLTISDNSRAADDLGAILESFRQSKSDDQSRSRSDLGMTVAAKVVEFIGGRIWVDSGPGSDCTLCVVNKFDVPETGAGAEERTALGLIPNLPVLIVDADENSSHALSQMLTHLQMHPEMATQTSDIAATLEQAVDAGHPFGLVIIDADIDGLAGGFALCQQVVEAPATAGVPVILMTDVNDPDQTRKAAAAGAAAHMPKPIKTALLEGAITTAFFGRSRYQELRKDLGAAETYVRSLIPAPTDEPLKIDWRYIPATELAGDALGFHWIDEDRCAFYGLDAAGHGIDACLQSVSILDAIKSQSLPDTDFCQPEQVLQQLNLKFPMESHDDRCFTIWYGVYDRSTSTLAWSGGGHPPALLLERSNGRTEVTPLSSTGPMVGMLADSQFPGNTLHTPEGSQLYVFSDGVFEIENRDGQLWTLDEFVEFVGSIPQDSPRLDALWHQARDMHGQETLDDDFTVMEVTF